MGERHPQTPPVWRHDALVTPAPHDMYGRRSATSTHQHTVAGDEDGIHRPTTAPCSPVISGSHEQVAAINVHLLLLSPIMDVQGWLCVRRACLLEL
jgi:hypothetical protein